MEGLRSREGYPGYISRPRNWQTHRKESGSWECLHAYPPSTGSSRVFIEHPTQMILLSSPWNTSAYRKLYQSRCSLSRSVLAIHSKKYMNGTPPRQMISPYMSVAPLKGAMHFSDGGCSTAVTHCPMQTMKCLPCKHCCTMGVLRGVRLHHIRVPFPVSQTSWKY